MSANPIKIVVESTGKCVGYACSECKLLHSTAVYACTGERAESAALDRATRCCICAQCVGCAGVVERGWTKCRACSSKEDAAKEQLRWDAATKVLGADYKGEFLYRDGYGADGYFSDACEQEEDEGPISWAWGCSEERIESCGLEDYVRENLLAEHHEDASDHVDWDKVREAEALLVEACSRVVSYQQDMSVVVLLGEPACVCHHAPEQHWHAVEGCEVMGCPCVCRRP